MPPEVSSILQTHNILSHSNTGITMCTVADSSAGVGLAKELLYGIVDSRTALYLSGGKTPKSLYEQLAREEQLQAGAVGMVDERYGKKLHTKSNEKMIRETELLRYLEIRGVPFYPMLQPDKEREETAAAYDEMVRYLHALFPRSVAVLGIGADGHTAGVAPNRKDFKNPLFAPSHKDLFVSAFDDPKSFYGQRVSMTFLGLSMVDVFLVLVFGEDKKESLRLLFEQGSEEEIPARFYTRPEIAKKTILITDQGI